VSGTRGRRVVRTVFPAAVVLVAFAACAGRQPATVLSPKLVSAPPLAYPAALHAAGVEGTVVIEGIVDTLGLVDPATVRIVSASESGFEDAARRMFVASLFEPARDAGRPVRALIRMPLAFVIQPERGVSVADSEAALERIARATRLIRAGQVTEALAAYASAGRLDHRVTHALSYSLDQCLYGAAWGFASAVMAQCDDAVALAPNAAAPLRARGIARALAGNGSGAIEDLETAARLAPGTAYAREAAEWALALREGRNPFTDEVLAALRR
jgi:TonB family protein